MPAPVDADRRPDFTPLLKASQTVGRALKRGDLVIYESTVYPGATEEICVPELERVSGVDFKVRAGARRAGDPARLVASNDKLEAAFGWEPRGASLDEITQPALAWEKRLLGTTS